VCKDQPPKERRIKNKILFPERVYRHGEQGSEAGQRQARDRPEAGLNKEASAGEENF